MAPCWKWQNQIPLRTELSKEEQKALEEHLQRCPSCARLAKQYEQDRQSLARLRTRSLPPSFWENFQQELKEKIRTAPVPSKVLPKILYRLSALATAASLLFLLLLIPKSQKEHSQLQPSSLRHKGLEQLVQFSTSLEEVEKRKPFFLQGRISSKWQVTSPPQVKIVTEVKESQEDAVEMDF